MTYLSRHCYDKPHCCPGWAGGGWKYPKKRRCSRENGAYLDFRLTETWGYPRFWQFHWHRHHCGALVVPHITRWIDPTWLKWYIGDKIKDAYWAWREKREKW